MNNKINIRRFTQRLIIDIVSEGHNLGNILNMDSLTDKIEKRLKKKIHQLIKKEAEKWGSNA